MRRIVFGCIEFLLIVRVFCVNVLVGNFAFVFFFEHSFPSFGRDKAAILIGRRLIVLVADLLLSAGLARCLPSPIEEFFGVTGAPYGVIRLESAE